MSSFAVEVTGLDELDAAIAAVTAVLTDPATAVEGALLIERAARPPRDKGTLDASAAVVATATGAQLVYPVPYSAIVHARHPWLGAAITASVTELVDLYETKVMDAWASA